MNRKEEKTLKEKNQQYILKLRKQLTLDDSESFYYSLVENIPQFIFCKDLEGRFTFVNQQFCNLLEKPIEDILGKTDFDFFPLDLAKKYREDDRGVIESNRTFEDIEKNKVLEHETKYVHVVKTPIHDVEGKIIGIQGIFGDITERIKAEEELRNANERMRQDLIAAAKVQRGFIPDKLPDIANFRFAWLFEPSEYIGGDLLNVLRLDEYHWAFYVLDVSGHGVPAALLSVTLTRMIDQLSVARETVREQRAHDAYPNGICDPKKLVSMLNKRFPGDSSKFCTLLYAILNTHDATISWIRAGHLPPLLVKHDGIHVNYFNDSDGSCISNLFLEENNLQVKKTVLEPGDRFVIYSDGITESMKNDEEYGYTRLSEVLRRSVSSSLQDSLACAYRDAGSWAGTKRFADDVTMLALERIY
ncbi:MAG: PAS domain S-box protein [Candidatus Omnitrophota bacterium]|jgi:sigma-B regulation protein RsbU (phosphoserine phosphatase)|nr:MAG: PAS domain S-box protein [Candidatus Omnitrophota bacterium]